ncbi:leukocyte elastase inhibitor-like [Periplaneta americana]|uniref:leukocyte elastase inhibitor-like n=1 Tax=Periplaneta americana TaxID=6978 RepID=UPI0037E7D825
MWTVACLTILVHLVTSNTTVLQSNISSSMVKSTIEFCIDLLKVMEWQQNVIVSPVVLYNTLSILQQGAEDRSQIELSNVLHSGPVQNKGGYGKVLRAIQVGNLPEMKLHMASKMYLAKKYDIRPEFLDTVELDFQANIENVDFEKIASAAAAMNAWVNSSTHGNIDSIVTGGQVTSNQEMVVLNAVYFSSKWDEPFSKWNTTMSAFNPSPGVLHKVPTMHARRVLFGGYSPILEAKYCVIPFKNRTFYMLLILPEEKHGLKNMINKLRLVHMRKIFEMRETRPVKLSIPRFRLSVDGDVTPVLQQLGVHDIFSERANFGGISKLSTLKVSQLIHKTTIDINENGVTASAFPTVSLPVGINIRASHPDVLEFKADHPFFFAIMHAHTSVPLFVGKLMDP